MSYRTVFGILYHIPAVSDCHRRYAVFPKMLP